MKRAILFLSLIATVAGALFAIVIEPHFVTALDHSVFINPESISVAMAATLLSPADLEAAAGRLSHFEGGKSFYTGAGDDLLAFEGDIRSFAQELDKNLEKQFTVSVVNGNAASRIALLQAGYLLGNTTLAPGQLVEGAFNDVNGAAGLTGATQEQKSIQELNLFLNACPTRLLAMKIQSTVAGQLNQNITYQRNNPFKDEETKTIRPKNYINQDTYQNDQVTFPVDVQLDQLSKLKYPFIGSSTNFVTYYFGASLNIIQALERKALRARTNISAVGANAVISAAKAKAMLGQG